MKTIVIGLGNPILTDDGIGIYTVRIFKQSLPPGCEIDVVELAVGGLQLMEAMIGYDRAIIVDAIWSPDNRVGEVLQFDAGHLPETMNSASAHDADLPTALKAGRELGAKLPCDQKIQVVAITAREVLVFGDELTPPVAAAIPRAVSAVFNLLDLSPALDLDSLSLSDYRGL